MHQSNHESCVRLVVSVVATQTMACDDDGYHAPRKLASLAICWNNPLRMPANAIGCFQLVPNSLRVIRKVIRGLTTLLEVKSEFREKRGTRIFLRALLV